MKTISKGLAKGTLATVAAGAMAMASATPAFAQDRYDRDNDGIGVGEIIAGALIILYQWYWMDAAITLAIAGYVLYQAATLLPQTVHILMEGTPEHLSIDEVIHEIMTLEQVESVHHVHVWQLDERRNALEAHVVVHEQNLADIEAIKRRIKKHLHDRFRIEHSTLEIELDTPADEACTGDECDTPAARNARYLSEGL